MSVYRDPAGRRSRLLAAAIVAAAVVGAIAGFVLARATDDDPTLAEQVAELRDELAPALSALELVTIEYREAVRDSEVVEQTEYDAARSQAASAAAAVDSAAEDLSLIAPEETEAAEQGIAELEELIEARADASEVGRVANAARGQLAAAAGTTASEPSP